LNNWKTVEVQTGTDEVQTIGIGFESKFRGGSAGGMELNYFDYFEKYRT